MHSTTTLVLALEAFAFLAGAAQGALTNNPLVARAADAHACYWEEAAVAIQVAAGPDTRSTVARSSERLLPNRVELETPSARRSVLV
ncbi:hypothetical protein HGRIS_013457 [Hohenbuehelia grisea]|uniref:Uncharacterized protein n=1 Tax=Hohenbuehelia grisea TaxID=104357 RepID=A0ABR3IVQ8_9AGAR